MPDSSISPPRLWALVPCAGHGSRAGGDEPKQYQPIAGRPMVMHTLAALAGVTRLAGGLLVVAPGDKFFEHQALEDRRFAVVACGGATRALTVAHGLTALAERGAAADDWVLVHDAARCLVTPGRIDALIDACLDDAVGGLLAQPLADTLKAAHGDRAHTTLDRRDRWLAQTPQMFRLGMLADALRAAGSGVTDEASAIEALGLQPRLVPGGAQNFKVTWPEDFLLAAAVLAAREIG
ncbi:2-C-methyl-D-erythritol 4-phosphate cytidylyltransferase [Xylophilus rhododendri]|uniref:2-C-methyl-D-erythritol 4-phosphate cytidylyltransferase n=1 Tax=Xylophilus rhododendri TaxID=2697032 RepID=A0A857J1H5_9BURK|nr:2-C-methyl-D-erythritol 4-phosphate cytidylyltransferase [Xylophilus rhododendri]QHI97009.1 2-C-methyl-D-erythritol 4-phosphate cytidylyltransferase [Xylophilus rhododendri]